MWEKPCGSFRRAFSFFPGQVPTVHLVWFEAFHWKALIFEGEDSLARELRYYLAWFMDFKKGCRSIAMDNRMDVKRVMAILVWVGLCGCMKQDPVQPVEPDDLSGIPFAMSNLQSSRYFRIPGDTTEHHRGLRISPGFHPDSLEYRATSRKGTINLYPLLVRPEWRIKVMAGGVEIPAVREDGTLLSRVNLISDIRITFTMSYPPKGQSRTYALSLEVQPDSEVSKLESMSLGFTLPGRGPTRYYTAIKIKPMFHPDSLDYSAEDSRGTGQAIFIASDYATYHQEVTVTFNGAKVQGFGAYYGTLGPVGETRGQLGYAGGAPGQYKVTVKDAESGISRTYTLSVEAKDSVNTGEWVAMGPMDPTIVRSRFIDGNAGYGFDRYGLAYRTVDGGKVWTRLNLWEGFAVISFESFNADTTYLIARKTSGIPAKGIFAKTIDGGATWVDVPVPFEPLWLSFPSVQTGFALAGSGSIRSIFKTEDGGTSWTEMGRADAANRIAFLDPDNGFRWGTLSKIEKTSDGGRSWAGISGSLDTTYVNFNISIPDAKTIIAGSGTDIFRTIDAGANWTRLNLPEQIGVKDFAFTGPDTGYALLRTASAGYAIVKTMDAGKSWITQYYAVRTTGFEEQIFWDLDFTKQKFGFAQGFNEVMFLGR
jgi:photosystem II stability/assembly factor-like uncharacterized protein